MTRIKTPLLLFCAIALCVSPALADPLSPLTIDATSSLTVWPGGASYQSFFDPSANIDPSDLPGWIDNAGNNFTGNDFASNNLFASNSGFATVAPDAFNAVAFVTADRSLFNGIATRGTFDRIGIVQSSGAGFGDTASTSTAGGLARSPAELEFDGEQDRRRDDLESPQVESCVRFIA